MDAERKLQKIKVTLMRNPKFALMSGILMVGKTSVVDNVPTASTNGRDELYGRKFVEQLTEAELGFLVLHECMHKMYRHLIVWKKLHDIDHSCANQACDYVINLELHTLDPAEQFIAMPKYKDGPLKGKKMGLLDMRFKGMNSKQVFDILRKEQEDGSGGAEGGQPGGQGNESGKQSGIDEHDWGGAQELSADEKRELERDVDQAIRQGIMAQKKAGAGGGDMSRELGDLMTPKVDWREELRDFTKSLCSAKDTSSWRRVNRRFLSLGSDTYMPSIVGEKIGRIVIGADTSGSIGGDELNEFLAEVAGIAEEVNPEKVDLLYWDGRVAAHEEYEGGAVSNIVSSTKPRGGGGTEPSCVSRYLNDKNIKPECIVMLTDGYVGNDWGSDWPAPIIWVISGSSSKGMVSSTGKTVYLEG